MPASYANRLNCKWARTNRWMASIFHALFISFAAISLAAADTNNPNSTPTVPARGTHETVLPGKTMNPTLPAGQVAEITVLKPATQPTPAPTADPAATPVAAGAGGTAPDSFAFDQFAATDGIYVLDSRTGNVRTVTADGQTCSFPFAGLETVPASALTTPGRFRGNLVQNALFVLDRQTGVLEKVLLSNLTRTVVLAAGAQPAQGAATAGGTAAAPNGISTTEGHLPPPPQYATVKIPAQVTDADRRAAERDIDDYSTFLTYPYIAAPLDKGYQLEVRIANRGQRTLAALEVTLEYTDPADQKLKQQRFYFRRDNGETNAPPGPGLERSMTLQLPTFTTSPVFKLTTSYLAFAD